MSIRYKCLLSALLVAALVLIGAKIVLNRKLDRVAESFVGQLVDSHRHDLQDIIDRYSEQALALAALFAKRQAVIEAYRIAVTGDLDDPYDPKMQQAREQLRATLADTLAGYRQALGGDLRLHFHTRNGRSLLRTWRPQQVQQQDGQWVDQSDDISDFRHTVTAVNRTGKPLRGIEVDREGFLIRGLTPIIDADGQALGTVETQIEMEAVMEHISQREGLDTALYMNSDLLPITTRRQDANRFPRLDDRYVLLCGQDRLEHFAEIPTAFLDQARSNEQVLTIAGTTARAALPIRDWNDRQIGIILFELDIAGPKALVVETRSFVLWVLLGLVGAMIFITQWSLRTNIFRPIGHILRFADDIAEDRLDAELSFAGKDEMGHLAHRLRLMRDALKVRRDKARELAVENARVRAGLDHATTQIMISDQQDRIVYINQAAQALFAANEAKMRRDLPNFRAQDLLGSTFDVFHRRPERQRRLIAELDGTHQGNFGVGGRQMQIIANPIKTQDGQRLGTVVEWQDRTERVQIETEINKIIAAAQHGQLDTRIAIAGKRDFYLTASQGINALIEVCETVLQDLLGVLTGLAAGDLGRRIDQDYEGMFAQIKDRTNAMADKLTEVIGQIQIAIEHVRSGAVEINEGNQDLSRRTESQAASLEQTAASMEEMSATVKQNADSTHQANDLVIAARNQADQGGEVVTRTVTAMAAISEASRKIGAILNVINEIAFQTNLLALNAAVEAARAGEQGRGFAVVANEVRNLAKRSGDAAKEIETLIKDSQQKTSEGSRLVTASGTALTTIVTSVREVSEVIDAITQANREQSQGIEQVNTAVAQMDQTTQQNAAMVEQVAAASTALVEQAQALEGLIGFFHAAARTD